MLCDRYDLNARNVCPRNFPVVQNGQNAMIRTHHKVHLIGKADHHLAVSGTHDWADRTEILGRLRPFDIRKTLLEIGGHFLPQPELRLSVTLT